jgi:integrase
VNSRYAYLRDDNPADGIKQLTIKPYGKATLLVDNQDIELLASIDRSTFDGLRDYTIILMFLTTGVRLAALAEATVASVRRQGPITYFSYVGKRAKAQSKRLPSNTARALLEYMQCRGGGDGLLFMDRQRIQYMLKKRCDAVFGVGHGITVHSLRHTAANNASKNGSIQDVRSLLDHESTRVTAVYLDHVTNDQGEKMSDLLDTRYG